VVYAECIRLTCSPHIACHSFPTLVIHFIPFSLKAVSSQYKGIQLHFREYTINGKRQLHYLTLRVGLELPTLEAVAIWVDLAALVGSAHLPPVGDEWDAFPCHY
jgi:hypothetical protein